MLRAGWYEKQVSKTGIIYRACAAERSILYITMQAARHAARQLVQRGATQMKSVRGMASDASSEKAHYEEAMKEMSKWRTVTYAAVPTCIAVAVWDLSHQHEHHEEVPDYPYMRIRSKDFPWGPCGLFEMNCPDAEGSEE